MSALYDFGPLPVAPRMFEITSIPPGAIVVAGRREVRVGDRLEDGTILAIPIWTAVGFRSLDVPEGERGARPGLAELYAAPAVAPAPPYVSRRAQIAGEIADRLTLDLAKLGPGGCICDDLSGDARRCIVQAIEDAMTREAETP